jgi:TP901-1 family phage major tail protein
MAATRGANMLLKYNTGTFGSPVWATMGGLRTRRMRVGRAVIDVTTADSANLERVLLSGGGVAMTSVSGDGVFEDTAAQAAAEAAARAGTFLDMQITVPGYGTYRGEFAVTDFEFAGDFDKELTFSCTFESAGAVTFTAL